SGVLVGMLVGPWPVVAARETIDLQYVPLKADAENAAKDGKRCEPRRAHTIVVIGNLVAPSGKARSQVDRLIHSPHVGLEQLAAAVAGSVGEQDDIFMALGGATALIIDAGRRGFA